jgi:hypothetical protein
MRKLPPLGALRAFETAARRIRSIARCMTLETISQISDDLLMSLSDVTC